MEEIYIILTDYPAYRISNKGKIQSRWRKNHYLYGIKFLDTWRDLSIHRDGKGYLMVVLCDGINKPKTHRIHNLVAKYFIGEKPKHMQVVRHLDSDKENNCAENLAYGTHLENENDKIGNGTWNLRNGGAKLTPTQVKEIREKLKTTTQNELAIQYGVSRPTITRIASNKIWKNL